MSARVVSLRAIVVEDIARTAERASRPAAAMLLRRFSDDAAAAKAVADDLRNAVTREARVAGAAAGYLADGGPRLAVDELAEFCGLEPDAWIEATCEEQGVAVAEVAA
ncbi:MAG: hypothetical protein R3A48_29115 [Polyangiales bacterium]